MLPRAVALDAVLPSTRAVALDAVLLRAVALDVVLQSTRAVWLAAVRPKSRAELAVPLAVVQLWSTRAVLLGVLPAVVQERRSTRAVSLAVLAVVHERRSTRAVSLAVLLLAVVHERRSTRAVLAAGLPVSWALTHTQALALPLGQKRWRKSPVWPVPRAGPVAQQALPAMP